MREIEESMGNCIKLPNPTKYCGLVVVGNIHPLNWELFVYNDKQLLIYAI